MIIQELQILIGTIVPLLLLSSFVSCCRFLIAFVRDIQENLYDLSFDVKRQVKLSTRQRIDIQKRLCDIIQLQAQFKQLS